MKIMKDVAVVNTDSEGPAARTVTFRKGIRSRDQNCTLSGRVSRGYTGRWSTFQAGHIFPVSYGAFWAKHKFSEWMPTEPARGGSINSLQNGLLMSTEIHELFDRYELSVNVNVRISKPPNFLCLKSI